MKIKAILLIVILVGSGLVGGYFLVNLFNYFDPWPFCHISIQGDILGGNEKTVKQALRFLKNSDPQAYRTTCRFVRVISEMSLILAYDPEVEGQPIGNPLQEPPCYIKGSKTIYLKSEKETSAAVIQERAAAIKEYGERSQKFWQGIGRD